MNFTKVTAHSGCEGTERDSMESIDKALAVKAELIEVDVRRDDMGILRISHNHVTQEEFEKKHTLREVFEKIKDTHLGINCDIKETYLIPDVLRLAKEFGLGPGRLLMTGEVDPKDLYEINDLTERADIYMNIEQVYRFFCTAELMKSGRSNEFFAMVKKPFDFAGDPATLAKLLPHLVEAYRTLGVKGINLPYQILTDEFAAELTAAGIPFSVWTVNDPAIADRILRLGAFNITTTSPKMVMEQRSQYNA